MDQKRMEELMQNEQVRALVHSVIDGFMKQGAKEQERKLRNFRELNKTAVKGQTLFTGSSLMEHFPITELWAAAGLPGLVYNRGIGGYTSDDFVRALDVQLLDLEPKLVFLNIGTNDMREWPDGRDWEQGILDNYEIILRRCREALPDTRIVMMAFYPVNPEVAGDTPFAQGMLKVRNKENLARINARLKAFAADHGCEFADANAGLTDEQGYLKAEYTVEGVHMYADAYRVVFNNLLPYLSGRE